MIRSLIAIVLLVTSSHAVTRGQPSDPARGSHAIGGFVVDAQTGAAVRRAHIEAVHSDGDRLTTVSDGQGRFALREVFAGKYMLSVSKPGYLPGSYGQVRPGGPGITIDVPGDLDDSNLKIAIFRGGLIRGRVVDERGDPVPLAQVRALQHQYEPGGRRLSWEAAQGSNLLTDDLGGFRLYGLPPGRYFVAASAGLSPSTFPGPPPMDARFPLMTYFPNTTDAADAQPIAVTAGKETAAIIITLGTGRPVRVRGRVIRSTGEPYEGGVSAAPSAEGSVVFMTSGSSVRPDGSFELSRLLPGSYLLTARNRLSTELKNPEVGHALVTVGTDDIDNVLIVTGRPGIARGRVVSDDGSPLPSTVTHMKVATVQPSAPDRAWRSNGPVRVKDDASFELDGLVGVHAFQIDADTQREWRLSSVWRRDQEITDVGVTFGPNDVVEDITLVVTRARNQLSGTVVDSNGGTTSDAWVIVFPADAALWKWPRWLRATQPDRLGNFRIDALPANDRYLVATVPFSELDDGDWNDPETLNGLRAHAVAVALGAAEKKVVNLRLGTR